MQKMFILSIVLVAMLIAPACFSDPQFSFILDNPVMQGKPGDTLTFSGTFSNMSGEEIFINHCSYNVVGLLTLDDEPFWGHFDQDNFDVPLSLKNGEKLAGEFFTISIAPDAVYGALGYGGNFAIYGGKSPDSLDDILAGSDFNVNVPAVPEPATLLGFGVPMVLVGFDRLRKKYAK